MDAILLVHGSGPLDMDETIYSNKPFRDLAFGIPSLSKSPIAVLRYNKRTNQHPSKFTAECTWREETIDDALEAAKYLKQWKGGFVKRIFVLGHSQGAICVPK